MSTTRAQGWVPRLTSRSLPWLGDRSLQGALLVLAVAVVASAVLRRVMTHCGQWSDIPSFLVVVAAFAGAACLAGVRYSDMSAPLRIVTRGIGIIVFLQILFDAFGPFPGPPNILFGGPGLLLYFRYGAIIGVIAGVAALWRPAFLMPMFLYYVGWRVLIGTLTGIAIVDTDYLGMIDVALFGVIGTFIAFGATLPQIRDRIPLLRWQPGDEESIRAFRNQAFALIWACAVGAHLGSYFWSAVAKIWVGGDHPMTWVLHNPTQTAIVIGLERGDNPLALWPHVVQAVWDGIAGAQPYMNAVIFTVQLLAPLAALGAPLLSIFCLIFDFFHIGVYVTLGALFFFWIAVNLIIVAAIAALPRGGLTTPMKAVMALTAIFGHYFFYTNHLGWLDSGKMPSPQFMAITKDHREVVVPSNYFGIYSYTIAQAAMYIPDGHFKFRLAGNSLDLANWKDARDCGPETIPHQETGVNLQTVKDMVLVTDRMMRLHPVIKSENLYYFYPHHMLPNPWVFTDFNALGIDDIVGYEYVVDSVCLKLKDGKLDRDVHKHSSFRIDLN